MIKYKIEPNKINDGIRVNSFNVHFFDTVIISISMVLPLKKETVARNALLPFVLCNISSKKLSISCLITSLLSNTV